MREKDVCFNCHEQGHDVRDCPHARMEGRTTDSKSNNGPESNSIRIQSSDGQGKRSLYDQKRDSRRYSKVVSGQSLPPPPNIRAINEPTPSE